MENLSDYMTLISIATVSFIILNFSILGIKKAIELVKYLSQ